MQSYLLAFITGLTTGGLSCLAVQGGLLASSLGYQIEKEMQAASLQAKGKKKKITGRQAAHAWTKRIAYATPILAFLVAKIFSYTVLGFLLGLVGSMFQLSPQVRAVLQISIGIFMVGSALRMLNVHPIFRHFVFEPPAFLRRHIRRTAVSSSTGDSISTSALLGALTVLIPCGITQAMMAAALGTGSPWSGAALMFAFTLGASPVFFSVVYFATQLGSRLEKHFMRFIAVVMLLLGFVAIDTGLTLTGSPVSFTQVFNNLESELEEAQILKPKQEPQVFDPNAPGPESPAPQEANNAGQSDGTIVTIQIQNNGYEPREVHAKAGAAVQLRLVSENVYSCSLAFIAPSLGLQAFLQSTDEKVFEIPAQESGTEVPFYCSMGMFTGKIVFDL